MRNVRVFACLLLALHTALLAWSGYRHSPTIDEPAHLAAGISHWQFGKMDLYSVNPPLVRMIAALPVIAAGPETRWGQFAPATRVRAEFSVGRAFADANGPRIFWLMTLARWACIPFSLLGGWVCFWWARELFGPHSGLLALMLWCFSPTVLGNGSLITADVPAAALCVTTTYVFYCWLKSPSWNLAFVAGVCLGIALLTKSSLIFLCALLPVIWAASRIFRLSPRSESDDGIGDQSIRHQLLHQAGMICLAILILNLGYGFEGTGTALKEFSFRSHLGGGHHEGTRRAVPGNRFQDSWVGNVPVPLPRNYVIGIDRQKFDFETGLRSYFLGEIRTGGEGWWWFYLYALAVKVPLGTWVLFLLSIAALINTRQVGRQFVLIAPAIFFFTLVSSQIGLHYFRYLLPAFPFGFILISQVASRFDFRRSPVHACFVSAALAWSVFSSLWYFPHSLSYFNELVGGPKAGYRLMADANVDWGQDLILLQEWIEENPTAAGMKLHYYGPVAPELAGIDVTDETSRQDRRRSSGQSRKRNSAQPAWIGVSVTPLAHQAALHRKAGGNGSNWFEYLYEREPDQRIGYTIHLYRVRDDRP